MKYIFNDCQLMTLLALGGGNRAFTFRTQDSFTDEEKVSAINHLYRLGALEEQNGRMVLAEPFATWIGVLQKAKRVIAIRREGTVQSQYLLYPAGDGKVVVLRSTGDYGNTLKLSCEDGSAFLADLKENEILPRSLLQERSEAEDLERFAAEELNAPEGDLQLRVSVSNAVSGAVEKTCEIVDTPALQLMRVSAADGSYTHLYAAKELSDLLEELLKGEES